MAFSFRPETHIWVKIPTDRSNFGRENNHSDNLWRSLVLQPKSRSLQHLLKQMTYTTITVIPLQKVVIVIISKNERATSPYCNSNPKWKTTRYVLQNICSFCICTKFGKRAACKHYSSFPTTASAMQISAKDKIFPLWCLAGKLKCFLGIFLMIFVLCPVVLFFLRPLQFSWISDEGVPGKVLGIKIKTNISTRLWYESLWSNSIACLQIHVSAADFVTCLLQDFV